MRIDKGFYCVQISDIIFLEYSKGIVSSRYKSVLYVSIHQYYGVPLLPLRVLACGMGHYALKRLYERHLFCLCYVLVEDFGVCSLLYRRSCVSV